MFDKETDVRTINKIANARLQSARVTPWVQAGDMKFRVTRAKTVKGQLMARTFNGWVAVDSVLIEY